MPIDLNDRIYLGSNDWTIQQIIEWLYALRDQGAGVSDAVYGAGWNGVTTVAPSKNALYDKIEAIPPGGPQASVKTANYTITTNEDIGVDSTGGAFTVTLKATPSAGDYAIIRDVAQNCGTAAVLIDRNGSTINGAADDESLNIDSGIYWFIYDGTTWLFTPITPGGLNQTAVDARVVEVASGVQRQFLRPEAELQRGTALAPTVNQPAILGPAAFWGVVTYTFSASTDQWTFWTTMMPPRYGLGTFRFRFIWRPSNTNTGVARWVIYPFTAVADLGAVSDTLGSPAVVDDTGGGAANLVQMTPWSSAVTVSGAADNTLISFLLMRQGSAAQDTFTGTSQLIGVEVEWTSNAPTDD